ncbi:MAG TPA: acetyltransferase [Pyrinomonadaceae bacterium]|jgi:acetyltransferase EpsM
MNPNRTVQVIIVGAGGHGSELHAYLRELCVQGSGIEFLGFIDDHRPRGAWGDTEVLGGLACLEEFLGARVGELHYITAVGSNTLRRTFVERLRRIDEQRLKPWTLQHPRAITGHGVEFGAGTCLAPGSIVTTNARIGSHCILNVNTSVSHDAVVGDYTNLNPGVVVAGNVEIGEGCYIGAGATLIDNVKIGEWSTIGAGAVVIGDIPPRVTAVGVPARVIKYHE